MTDLLYAILAGDEWTWDTEKPHADNNETMREFLKCHLPDGYEVTLHDGTYAEIHKDGLTYGVHASGRGDFCSHIVKFFYI